MTVVVIMPGLPVDYIELADIVLVSAEYCRKLLED
jgi:hypothetical protein